MKRRKLVIEMRDGSRKLLSDLFSIRYWLIAPAESGRYKLPPCLRDVRVSQSIHIFLSPRKLHS